MKKFMYGIAAMSLALAFTGCDDDDPVNGNGGGDGTCIDDFDCGGYACDLSELDENDEGVCLDECVAELDCSDGYTCDDSGECVPEDGAEAGYNKILLVSRTDIEDESSCGASTPGPDIDFVRANRGEGEDVYPSVASGIEGDSCEDKYLDQDPSIVLEQTSIDLNNDGEEAPGYCALGGSATGTSVNHVYAMGTGQPASETTIQEGTGVLLVEFADAFEDGDIIEVGEVGIESEDSDSQICQKGEPETDEIKARPGDRYGIYLVSSNVDSVGPGTELVAPDFIELEADVIGLVKSLVILD